MAVCILGIAASLKLLDLGEFADVVRTWSMVPRWMVYPVAIAVPVSELLVAGAWFAGAPRRAVFGGGAALLIVATAAYLTESLVASPPQCGCFGGLAVPPRWETVAGVVTRNGLLVGMLLCATRGASRAPAGRRHCARGAR
ncbi:MAG: hypothetical protein IT431_13560 [Phycisphaerales bacterium]|nr:hypothetical protein [Phycisphaerales bacterium]